MRRKTVGEVKHPQQSGSSCFNETSSICHQQHRFSKAAAQRMRWAFPGGDLCIHTSQIDLVDNRLEASRSHGSLRHISHEQLRSAASGIPAHGFELKMAAGMSRTGCVVCPVGRIVSQGGNSGPDETHCSLANDYFWRMLYFPNTRQSEFSSMLVASIAAAGNTS